MTDNEFYAIKFQIEKDLLFRHSKEDIYKMLLNAIDLINRQKAEIENYIELVKDSQSQTKTAIEQFDQLKEVAYRQKAEIERLQKNNILPSEGFFNLLCGALVYTKTLEEYNKFRRTFKAGAIKEFAERLKLQAYFECDISGHKYQVVQIEEIDSLVEEMVGDV